MIPLGSCLFALVVIVAYCLFWAIIDILGIDPNVGCLLMVALLVIGSLYGRVWR